MNSCVGPLRLRRALRWAASAVTVLAFVTYLLTMESGASFWDCPEYIASAARLEPGHPPGNPVYMLAGRVATFFAPSPDYYALALNVMSALFSALTAGLLVLTTAWFARKLLLRESDAIPLWKSMAVVGSGVSAGLIFAWSDTFWFSAVEAEVYAFASLSTAMLLWILLVWYDRADRPHSDRYLILAAYVAGLSTAIHELNLLVIPALSFIVVYRRCRRLAAWQIIGTLLLSFFIVALILLGLMQGMVRVAQEFELVFVNGFGLAPQSGLIAWAVALLAAGVLMLAAIDSDRNKWIKVLTIVLFTSLSGVFLLNGNHAIMLLLTTTMCALLLMPRRFPARTARVAAWSLAMAALGLCSYGTVIIRGHSAPPMNQGAPSDIFAFGAYLQREQYGEHPLLRGRTPYAENMREERLSTDSAGKTTADYSHFYRVKGPARYFAYVPGGKTAVEHGILSAADSAHNATVAARGRGYVLAEYKVRHITTPELDMWFSRVFSPDPHHIEAYESWVGMTPANMERVRVSSAVDSAGNFVPLLDEATGKRPTKTLLRPTQSQNLSFLGQYQVYYMYLRYLLWNFAGRQNDRASQGEIDAGNFLSGIPAIDNAMLGPQNKVPAPLGADNRGRNVYYFLPLILGIAGIALQLASGKRGRRQFTVILTLFVMTGVAIVIYLNQTPGEPRERDYSFAGSFYAFAIWAGLGIAALFRLASRCRRAAMRRTLMAVACGGAIGVPVLMLAENYDDHNRSGRTAATDSALNALRPLAPGAILFTNGDNLLFPLWYAQEVLGVRRDVRVVNIGYLGTPWYRLQLMRQNYSSLPLPMTAQPGDVAYGTLKYVRFPSSGEEADAVAELKRIYSLPADSVPSFSTPLLRAGEILIDLRKTNDGKSFITPAQLAMLDIAVTNASQGFPRPLYWTPYARPKESLGLTDRLRHEALFDRLEAPSAPDRSLTRSYRFFTGTCRWLGADRKGVYIDEIAGEQVTLMRRRAIATAQGLMKGGERRKALQVARLAVGHLPYSAWPMAVYTEEGEIRSEALDLADILTRLGQPRVARALIRAEAISAAQYQAYYHSLAPAQRRVLSPASKIRRLTLHPALEAWIRAGGTRQQLLDDPALCDADFGLARREWEKDRKARLEKLSD